jgi:hypothetical protein
MYFGWKRNVCGPSWNTPYPILGIGAFALASTMYLNIQLFEIQILKGILALTQNAWSLRQTFNNVGCSKSSILSPGFFPRIFHLPSYFF